MRETAELGSDSEGMPHLSTAGGDAEALATTTADLKLADGDGRGDEVDRDADSEDPALQVEGEEGGMPGKGKAGSVDVGHSCVLVEESVSEAQNEKSETDEALEGQEEWREEEDVSGEVMAQEDEKGAPAENVEKDESGSSLHPQRPGVPDCAYYVRTGHCAFGAKCKFNHPLLRGKRVLVAKSSDSEKPRVKSSEGEKCEVKEKEDEDNSGGMGQVPCKYYQTSGGCKYGSNCRYMHAREQSKAGPELNILGLPIRIGEKECPFYMRTGSCKYGSNCRFHHPNPAGVDEPGPVSGGSGNGSPLQHFPGMPLPHTVWRPQSNSNQSLSINTQPGILLPHQLHRSHEWNGYQAPLSPLYSQEGNKKYTPVQATYLPTNTNGHSGRYPVQNEEYPQRPGQPECQFYMENGSCKYKSACRFHHPKDRLAKPAMCLLSPMGLPLRPGQPLCAYFSRHGICKFGPTCRFDHPMDRGSSRAHPRTVA